MIDHLWTQGWSESLLQKSRKLLMMASIKPKFMIIITIIIKVNKELIYQILCSFLLPIVNDQLGSLSPWRNKLRWGVCTKSSRSRVVWLFCYICNSHFLTQKLKSGRSGTQGYFYKNVLKVLRSRSFIYHFRFLNILCMKYVRKILIFIRFLEYVWNSSYLKAFV